MATRETDNYLFKILQKLLLSFVDISEKGINKRK